MKRVILPFLLALLLLPAANVAAQEGFTFMSFNLGHGFGIFLDDTSASDDIESITTFGIDFRIADPLIVGFSRHTVSEGAVDFNVNLLNIKFDVMPMVRPVISIGQGDGEPMTGLGFEIIPFRRSVGDLFTELKLVPHYLFWPADGIGDGIFTISLMLGIGF